MKTKLPLIVAIVHVILFIVMCIDINMSNDGQAPMNWVIFALLDFPISLLYFLDWPKFTNTILATIFYPPYFIHGLLGAIWWYVVANIILKVIGTIKKNRSKNMKT